MVSDVGQRIYMDKTIEVGRRFALSLCGGGSEDDFGFFVWYNY